jgi:hypothetical protein
VKSPSENTIRSPTRFDHKTTIVRGKPDIKWSFKYGYIRDTQYISYSRDINPPFVTFALGGTGWSASSPGRFNPGQRAPGTNWIAGLLDPGGSLEAVEKTQTSCPLKFVIRQNMSNTSAGTNTIMPYSSIISAVYKRAWVCSVWYHATQHWSGKSASSTAYVIEHQRDINFIQ